MSNRFIDRTGGSGGSGGTVTANQGLPAPTADGWPVKVTDGTHTAAVTAASTPPAATDEALVVAISPNSTLTAVNPSVGFTGVATPGSATLIGATDGTNLQAAVIKSASTSAAATDPALVVALSPNIAGLTGQETMADSLPVVIASDQSAIPVSGTVTANVGTTGGLALDATLTGGTQTAIARGGAKGTTVAADVTSTPSGADHQALDVSIYDAAGNLLGVAGSALSVDGSAVTQPISAASLPLPTGAATETTLSSIDGKIVTVDTSNISGTVTADQGAAAATAGAWPTKVTDGTNVAAVMAASTSPTATDPALVVTISPNSPSLTGTTASASADVLGEDVVAVRRNQIEISFYSAPGASLITNSFAGGGSATVTSGHTLYSTGAGVTSSAAGVSVAQAIYRPANETYSYFTAAFTTPTDLAPGSNHQRIGLFDAVNGFYIGYEAGTFGVTKRTNSVNTFIPRLSWNGDPLDGSPGSKFTRNGTPEAINFTFSNLFRIRFAWLGSASILFEVFSPDGQWVVFNTIQQPNSALNPSLTVPNLPMTIDVAKTASDATDLTIATACWAAGTTSDVAPVTDTLTDQSLAALSRSVIAGRASTGGGTYYNVKVTPSGSLTVALGDISGVVGQQTMANSLPVVIASNQSAVPVSGTVTANVGTTGGLALDATLTGGTQKAIVRGGAKGTTVAADVTSTPSGVNHQPLDVSIYDAAGNLLGVAGSALKVDGSSVTQPVSGTVTANQGTAAATAGAWPTKVTDGTNTAAVKAASTPAVLADPSLVVALSPNSPNPLTADISGTGSIAALNGNVVVVTAGVATLAVLVAGTWTGTLSFQFCIDGGTWVSDTAQNAVSGAFVSSTTTVGSFLFSVGGYNRWRIIATAWSSGTATITYEGSAAPNVIEAHSLITDGSNNGPVAVKVGAAPVAGDPALVVVLSPNSSAVSAAPAKAGTSTRVDVLVTTANQLILAADTTRLGATVFNNSTANLYLSLSTAAATTSSFSVLVPAFSYYEVPFSYTGQIRGTWDAAVAGNALVTWFQT